MTSVLLNDGNNGNNVTDLFSNTPVKQWTTLTERCQTITQKSCFSYLQPINIGYSTSSVWKMLSTVSMKTFSRLHWSNFDVDISSTSWQDYWMSHIANVLYISLSVWSASRIRQYFLIETTCQFSYLTNTFSDFKSRTNSTQVHVQQLARGYCLILCILLSKA